MAFNYNISVTGDCGNFDTGRMSIYLTGSTPPYTIEIVSPISETFSSVDTTVFLTGLSATTYVFRVNDSSLPINEEYYINVPISNGVCGGVVKLSETTCNLNNGAVVLSATSLYSSTNYSLFDTKNNFISSGITNTSQFEFNNLFPGTYYCLITDLGGCTGRTSDFIIENSTSLDFGLYTVPNTSCGGLPIGKIFVTGQTGVPPYTYLWSNGQSTSSITGISEGVYSVQVSDSSGCQLTKSTTVSKVPPIGLGVVNVVQPHPLSNDGSITITSSGGTAPFYYSASTGNFEISYSQSWTLSGLPYGDYIFSVTDAAFCNYQTSVNLLASDGISSVDVIVDNSFSFKPTGSITAEIIGGFTPYTYRLIYPNTNVVNVVNNLQTYIFNNLASGEYVLMVQDSAGSTFSENILISNDDKFYVQTLVTGSTCNLNNGIVQVNLTWNECNCSNNLFYIFNKDILSASGNTDTNLDNKVWVEYLNCNGEITIESFSSEGIYEFCSNGSSYTNDSISCFDNDLCCQWRIFNEGETSDYTYSDCNGNDLTISVVGGEYSKTFCSVSPPNSPLFTIEHVGPCSECNCYDATTDGDFEYYDCNNIFRQGTSSGVSICVNKNRPFSGIIVGTESISCSCNVPIIYISQDNNQVNLPEGYFVSTNENCCNNNGPSFPVTYSLDNGNQIVSNTFLTTVIFNDLPAGSHSIKVTDSQGYEVSQNFVIDTSEGPDFTLFATSCGDGDEGSISVIINNGTPPFEFIWSDNVPGNPQEILIENLTAGTYTLSVIDNNGCCTAKVVDISCNQIYNPYLYYTMGEDILQITPIGKCSLLKYLNDGFQEIQDILEGCELSYAIFSVKVSLLPNGYSNQNFFYTSTALTDVPSDQLYLDTIVNLISGINGVWKVYSDLVKNEIVVYSLPGSDDLNGQEIQIELIIDYFLDCLEVI